MDDDEGIWKLAPEEFMENETFEDASKNEEFVFRHRKIASGSEVSTEGEEDDDEFSFSLPSLDSAKEQAEQFVKKVWDWNVTHFKMLPEWLQDNDFVCSGYRPPLPSCKECFKSIFRVHNETGNIWSHMLGCIVFSFIAIYFVTRPDHEVQLQEKLVFSIFFVGVVACLALSSVFHTLCCHSERVGRLVLKLDYVGITVLIICSFIPWIFYGFYCRPEPKITYTATIIVLGIGCIIVSFWEKFSEPNWRPVRAGMFLALAASGIIPSIHYIMAEGFSSAINDARFDWLMLMALLYIFGTMLYAMRIPERFFPGKFDIWFQSHQLFHFFVIIGAFVHYRGISEMAIRRLTTASCKEQPDEQFLSFLTGSPSA